MARKKFQEVALTGDEVVKTQELREQCRNAARFKSEMVHAAGGVFGEEAVRALLELPSKEAVHQAVRQRNLLAVEDSYRLWFPRCQFQRGTVYPGIRAILKAIPETSGWRILQYLHGRMDGLAGDRPIDLIKDTDEDIDRAMRFATILES